MVNLAGYESGIPELTSGLTLQVLQDTDEAGVADAYGAERWYLYLVDRDGIPRVVHYSLDFDDERDRLLSEIATLVAEAR